MQTPECVPADGDLQSPVRSFDQSDGLLPVPGQLHLVDDDDLIAHPQRPLHTVCLAALLYLHKQTHNAQLTQSKGELLQPEVLHGCTCSRPPDGSGEPGSEFRADFCEIPT